MRQEEILDAINDLDLNYGTKISVFQVARYFSISVPEPQFRNDYDIMTKFDLQMLSAYDALNETLMTRGRKIVRQADLYVVPTIEGTLIHVDRYQGKSSKAYGRAQKLLNGFWLHNPDYINEDDQSRAALHHRVNERNEQDRKEPSF